MKVLKKLKSNMQRSLWQQILFYFISGMLAAVIAFFLIWHACNKLSYIYLMTSNSIQKSETYSLDSLQSYASTRKITAENVGKLQQWYDANPKIRYLCVLRDNTVLFDMGSRGFSLKFNLYQSGFLVFVQRFAQTVRFQDGTAEVYLDTGVFSKAAFWATCISALSAACIWILILRYGVRKIEKQSAPSDGSGTHLQVPQAHSENSTLRYKNLSLNLLDNEVELDGQRIVLTEKEYRILKLMLQNPDHIFSAKELFTEVWKQPFLKSSANTIMVHIRHLRGKIEKDPKKPEIIRTVWGKGYVIHA